MVKFGKYLGYILSPAAYYAEYLRETNISISKIH